MNTKKDDGIRSICEKYIKDKFFHEGYVRLDRKVCGYIEEFCSENSDVKFVEDIVYDYILTECEKKSKPIDIGSVEAGTNIYIFNRDLIKIHEIKNVPEYISSLFEYKEEDMFFRGQSDSNYLLQPSIVREIRWRKNEKLMFDELERLCPKEFYNLNTILDKLVEMQHYNLPTRLLDVSSNALVALLFACQNCETDGEVLIFKDRRDRDPYTGVKETNIRYGHSDSVSLLTGISQMNYRDQLLLYYIARFFMKLITEKIPITSWFNAEDNIDKWDSEIRQICKKIYGDEEYPEADYSIKQLYALKEAYKKADGRWVLENKIKNFNSIDVVRRLYRQVQREKPYFESRIVPEDVVNVLFVKPSMLNQRIVKQSGAFIIVGAMSEDNSDIVKALNSYRFSRNGIRPVFIIPAECKKIIQDELRLCDLHAGAIYPEIEKVAAHIKGTMK